MVVAHQKKFLVLALIVGAFAGGLTSYLLLFMHDASVQNELTQDDLIKDFYYTETAVHVSPHHIRKGMAKGDDSFILIDLRSQEEYEREHIMGAINIPAYKDPDHSAYGDVERIVNSFSDLPQDKDLIVYCYSGPCMTGRKVGKILAENGVYVKHLGIGWNEWRYHWTIWNHEHEWNVTDVMDYVVSGPEPGSFSNSTNNSSTVCPIDNEFGC